MTREKGALIFGRMKLADYLTKHDLSQAEFAEIVSVSQARIAQLCSGDMPSLKLAQRIDVATKGAVRMSEWGGDKKAA